MFTRQEVLSHPEYWLTGIGITIFNALIPHLYPGIPLPEPGEPMPAPPKHIYQELATKCEVSVRTIRLMAQGDYRGSIEKLVKVFTKLGIAPEIVFKSTLEDIV